MKFLFVVPLIFSWNFMFWGTIGFLRYIYETVCRYNSILVPIALVVFVFLLTAYPASVVTDARIPILFGVISITSILLWRYVSIARSASANNDIQIRLYHFLSTENEEPQLSVNPQKLAIDLARLERTYAVPKSEQDYYIRFAQMGNNEARSQLMDSNQHLVRYSVTTFADQGLSRNDLRHLATVGLSYAVRTFDQTANYQFSSHAILAIFQNIESALPKAINANPVTTISKSSDIKDTTLAPIEMHDKALYEPGSGSVENYGNELNSFIAVVIVAMISASLWSAGYTNLDKTTDADSINNMGLLGLALLIPLIIMVAASRRLYSPSRIKAQSYTANISQNYLATRHQVAVLVPAYNEGAGIEPTVRSAIELVGFENVFVVNDCSSDDTSEILKRLRINQLDLTTNVGKAKALDTAIKHFQLCDDFEFLLILDADTEIDCDYLKFALPKFVDPNVSVVAGHAIPKWDSNSAFSRSSFYVAYRIKLYMLTQAFLRYGQTSSLFNVSFIIPGFSSIYRTKIIPKIDITAPGLVIEDFNMTFELHKKKLGRIAYSPRAVARCHEPHSFKDYSSQIKRWHLGFWQTVVRHGFWKSQFSVALMLFILESLIVSVAFISLPVIGILTVAPYFNSLSTSPIWAVESAQLFVLGVLMLLALDWISTAVIAWIIKNPALLWHGMFFFILRWVDSLYFILTLPMVYFVKSNGRWKSPSRSITH